MENIQQIAKNERSNSKKVFLVYLISIIGGIILTKPLSSLYIYLFPPPPGSSGFFGFNPDPHFLLDGFVIGYIFFLSLLVVFLGNKKLRFWTWFWGILLFQLITLGEWKYFGFNLLVAFIGYSVGLVILYIKNRIKLGKVNS